MNKLFLSALACLAILVPAGKAVQLSDLSPTLTRTEADDNLTKDYAYRVLSDLSVRRIWNLDDNRKLSIDFGQIEMINCSQIFKGSTIIEPPVILIIYILAVFIVSE